MTVVNLIVLTTLICTAAFAQSHIILSAYKLRTDKKEIR